MKMIKRAKEQGNVKNSVLQKMKVACIALPGFYIHSDSAADKGTIPGEKRGYSGSNIDAPDYASEAARSGMRQKVTGVVTERGRIIPVRSVVLTTGTFLGGRIFIGEYDAPCGRVGEPAAYGLTASLHRLGFTTGRLKTGTPPRILKRTIDFDKLELEPGDEEVIPFSFEDEKVERPMYLPFALLSSFMW